jgi:hypothetical protein
VLIKIALAVIFLSLLTVISISVFDRGRLLGLIPMFSMDREANVPTLLAVLLLFTAAGLIYLLSRQLTASADRFSRHVTRLSYIFIFMAVDEFTSIHELFTNPLGALTPKTGIFHYSWVIVGIPVVIIVGLYYLRFFLAQSKEFKLGLFFAGFIFVFGAIGMEMVGGSIASAHGVTHIGYGLATLVEESCEIFGVIILINALLVQLQKNGDGTLLHITMGER